MSVTGNFEEYYKIVKPTACNGCKNPKYEKMEKSDLTNIGHHCRDYQDIKVQERFGCMGIGSVPGSIWVAIEDELVGKIKPGE